MDHGTVASGRMVGGDREGFRKTSIFLGRGLAIRSARAGARGDGGAGSVKAFGATVESTPVLSPQASSLKPVKHASPHPSSLNPFSIAIPIAIPIPIPIPISIPMPQREATIVESASGLGPQASPADAREVSRRRGLVIRAWRFREEDVPESFARPRRRRVGPGRRELPHEG